MHKEYTPFYAPVFSATALIKTPAWSKLAAFVSVESLVRLSEEYELDTVRKFWANYEPFVSR